MTWDKSSRIILLGPPGAGKGTQAKLLAQALGITHIASGNLFRYHLGKGTALGIKAKEYMTQGLLVPDDITITMVLEEVLSPANHLGFILDGFPRNIPQAEALISTLSQRGARINQVFLIVVPREELVQRLAGRWICHNCQTPYHEATPPLKEAGKCDRCDGQLYQREDDRPEAVNRRVEVYQSETKPLIAYYRRQDHILEVDGVGSVDDVNQRLLEALQRSGLRQSLIE